MQTRTKKTLATGALGLAFAAAAAATGASAASAAPLGVVGPLPVGGTATNIVPGGADSAWEAQNALTSGTTGLPGDPAALLPSGNHLDGNQIAPVGDLLGGLPIQG